jgi:hypothetical protein
MTPDRADRADPLDPLDPGMTSKSAESDGVLFKNTLWAPKMGPQICFLMRISSFNIKNTIFAKININSKKKRLWSPGVSTMVLISSYIFFLRGFACQLCLALLTRALKRCPQQFRSCIGIITQLHRASICPVVAIRPTWSHKPGQTRNLSAWES